MGRFKTETVRDYRRAARSAAKAVQSHGRRGHALRFHFQADRVKADCVFCGTVLALLDLDAGTVLYNHAREFDFKLLENSPTQSREFSLLEKFSF